MQKNKEIENITYKKGILALAYAFESKSNPAETLVKLLEEKYPTLEILKEEIEKVLSEDEKSYLTVVLKYLKENGDYDISALDEQEVEEVLEAFELENNTLNFNKNRQQIINLFYNVNGLQDKVLEQLEDLIEAYSNDEIDEAYALANKYFETIMVHKLFIPYVTYNPFSI